MKQVTQQLTGYFRDVQKRSNLVDQAFGPRNKYKLVPFDKVKSGQLSEAVTQELFEWDAEPQGDSSRRRLQKILLRLIQK